MEFFCLNNGQFIRVVKHLIKSVKKGCHPVAVSASLECGKTNSLRFLEKNDGPEVKIGSAPWHVYLTTDSWDCNGVLISDRVVLTTAHCVTSVLKIIELIKN